MIDPSAESFGLVERALTDEKVGAVLQKLKLAHVQRRFVRFEFRTQVSPTRVLSSMGMRIALTDDVEFLGMSEMGADHSISDVLRGVFISVDEAGTEAAVATAGAIGVMALPHSRSSSRQIGHSYS